MPTFFVPTSQSITVLSGRGRVAYAWSFWRCCGLLEVDGYCEVDVFAEVAALQIAGVAKDSLIDRGSNAGPEQRSTAALVFGLFIGQSRCAHQQAAFYVRSDVTYNHIYHLSHHCGSGPVNCDCINVCKQKTWNQHTQHLRQSVIYPTSYLSRFSNSFPTSFTTHTTSDVKFSPSSLGLIVAFTQSSRLCCTKDSPLAASSTSNSSAERSWLTIIVRSS
jgi:hypothetical protein